MKEIIGDDYPTYEESVNLTLAEKAKASDLTLESACTYLNEVEQKITKENMERLMKENFQLRHRLACIADDIEIIDRHIQNNCNKKFKKPSLNADGTIYADQAWHNVSNIEIACDLDDDEPLHWGSKVKHDAELDNLNRDL
ncbi:MAG: hypothetical protein EBY39_08310 [Flavobacteriia bacterium]|nr:hypothetical protein [Flavobacteriia bacterium]